MGKAIIDAEILRQRIKALKEEVRSTFNMRRFYGETGFRGSKITDDLLREAKQKEAQIKEYEALLEETEKP